MITFGGRLLPALRKSPGRQEIPEQGLAIIGAVLTIAAVAGTAVALNASHASGSDAKTVTVAMSEIGGSLGPGADVKSRGLVVGRVGAVTRNGSAVVLSLDLDASQTDEIPASSVARILPATVFGTSFVDLVPGAEGGPMVADGAVLEQDRSSHTLELQRALDSVDELVTALSPAKLSQVLHAVSATLDGRGHRLGATVGTLNDLLRQLNPKMPVLGQDLDLLATNLRTLRVVAPDLLDGLDDTTAVASTLVQRRAQLADLLRRALGLVGTTNEFLDATEVGYLRDIALAARVSDAVFDNRAGLSSGAAALRKLLLGVFAVIDGTSIPLNVRPVNPDSYRYYTAEDCPRYGMHDGGNCRGVSR